MSLLLLLGVNVKHQPIKNADVDADGLGEYVHDNACVQLVMQVFVGFLVMSAKHN